MSRDNTVSSPRCVNPHGAAFFHLAPTHQHVVCEVCGRIEDVPSSEFDDLVDRLRDHHGFELDVCHTALVGRCSEPSPFEQRSHSSAQGTTAAD